MEARRNRTAAAAAVLALVAGGALVVHAAVSDSPKTVTKPGTRPLDPRAARTTMTASVTPASGATFAVPLSGARVIGKSVSLDLGASPQSFEGIRSVTVRFTRGDTTTPFLSATFSGPSKVSVTTASLPGQPASTLTFTATRTALTPGTGDVPATTAPTEVAELAGFPGSVQGPSGQGFAANDSVTTGSRTATLVLPWSGQALPPVGPFRGDITLGSRATPTSAFTLTRTLTGVTITRESLTSNGQGAPSITYALAWKTDTEQRGGTKIRYPSAAS